MATTPSHSTRKNGGSVGQLCVCLAGVCMRLGCVYMCVSNYFLFVRVVRVYSATVFTPVPLDPSYLVGGVHLAVHAQEDSIRC